MAEPTITGLRAFIHVAEELHFTRAAELMHLTTPALSQQIYRLETALGTDLFIRSSRRVELTEAGAQLLPLAEDAVHAFDRLRRWSSPAKDATIRVGFIHAGIPAQLGDFPAAVGQELGGAQIDLRGTDRTEAIELLKSGKIDLLFSWGPNWFDGVINRTLTTAPRVVVFATDQADAVTAGRAEITLSALREQTFLVPSVGDDRYVSWALADPRPDGSRPKRGLAAHNLEEVFALVASGNGVYLLPEPTARMLRHEGTSWARVTDVARAPFNMTVADRPQPSLLKKFMELIQARFDA